MVRLRSVAIADLPLAQEAAYEPCYLYVIREAQEDHYKLGVTGHPARRLSALQGGNRRRLALVATYVGTRANCLFVEKTALRYFKAPAGSEWVGVENVDEITEFLGAFCEDSE